MASDERLAALAKRGVGGDAHHPLFPPSSAKRWLTCTASPLPISHDYQGDDTNIYSAEGTFAHAVFADMVAHAGTHPNFHVGQTYPVNGFEFELTHEVTRHLGWCMDIVFGLGVGVLMAEQRVGFDAGFVDGVPRTVVEGTADVLLQPHAEPHVLHVLDLKYGRGERVMAEWNPQMLLYALGSLATHSPMLFDSVTEVEVHVLQPRLDHHDRWGLSVRQLYKWRDTRVEPAVAEVLDGTGEFRPSEDGCRWCPIAQAGACRAQATHIADQFDVLSEAPDNAKKAEAEAEANRLEDEELAPLYRHLAWVERVLAGIKNRAQTTLLAGGEVPGFKLVLGRKPPRQWSEPSEDRMGDIIRVESGGEVEPWERKLVSVASAEKQMGRREFEDSKLPGFVTQDDARPTLALEEDPRAAWAPADADDFDIEE